MATGTKESVFYSKIKKGKVVSLRLKEHADPAAVEDEIKEDISGSKLRVAIEKAKEYHKAKADERSEKILTVCYYARIRNMIDNGMVCEVRELLRVLEGKLRVKDQEFTDLRWRLSLLNNDYDTILKLLDNPALDRQQRLHLETMLRQSVFDVSQIADSAVLSDHHPLRRAARCIQDVFGKVTTGPVSDEEVLLPEVSRRSPLYPWKLLIRAIAFLYQNKPAPCLEAIGQIDTSDAVYKLAVVIQDVLEGKPRENLTAAQTALFGRLRGESPALVAALKTLDSAMEAREERRLPSLIGDAIRLCGVYAPQKRNLLKQHIFAKGALLDLDPQKVCSAFGTPELHNANFWRLFAQVMERSGNHLMACLLWAEFRRHAIHEQWFSPNSPEAGMFYLHMADVLSRIDPDDLDYERNYFQDVFDGLDYLYDGQPAAIRNLSATDYDPDDPYFLHPELLFERAAACQPNREVYSKWLTWAQERATVAEENAVAERWHQAFPDDVTPVLQLIHLAARRQAYNKGLKWAQKAEQIDPLNPEIKSAKLRLIFSKAARHLRQKKLHLVEKDLEEFTQQPQAQQGDIPIFIKGLEWLYHTLRPEPTQAQACFEQIHEKLESQTAAILLLIGIADQCGHSGVISPSWLAAASVCAEPEFIDAAGRVCLLLDKAGFDLMLPGQWFGPMTKAVETQKSGFSLDHLLGFSQMVSRFAADRDMKKLLFALSAKGLRAGGPHRAAFLEFRAQTLRYLDARRRENCLKASAELARRAGNTVLYSKAVEQLTGGYYGEVRPQDMALDEKTLETIVAKETKANKLPKPVKGGWFKTNPLAGVGKLLDETFAPDPECDCPSCRQARGETKGRRSAPKPSVPEPTLFDAMEEADNFADEDEPDMSISIPSVPDLNVDALAFLSKILKLNDGRFPSKQELDRIFLKNPQLWDQFSELMSNGDLDSPLDSIFSGEETSAFDDDEGFYDTSPRPRLNRKDRRKQRKKERKNRKQR